MALICAAIFAACNCAPTLRYLVLAPNNGTIYVSSQIDGAKGARRAARTPVHNSRHAAVTPRDITTAVCGSLQYAATGYYTNGTTQDKTSAVTWSSSDTTVATIDNTGLATGAPFALGFTNIGATLGGITAATTQLEVDQLNFITVAAVPPVTNPLPAGQTQQFSATGSFTLAGGGGADQDISGQVFWATDDPTVATIDQTGLVTAVGSGTARTTTVTATSCDEVIVGTATVTVTGATTLVITPSTITASTGTTVQYTAMERLNDGTLQAPQSPVSWSSGATNVASINSGTGLAQALTASITAVTITASEPGNTAVIPGTASLTVQAAAARFAYVANINSNTISSYIVNVGSSTPLTPNTNDTKYPSGVIPAIGNPQQILLHPSGDLLFYIDSNGAINSNCVDSTKGIISTATGQPGKAATDTTGDIYVGVIDPTGRFIYVITNGSSVLYGFTITHNGLGCTPNTTDGVLTGIPDLTSSFNDGTLNFPSWIMTDQAGMYLYVVNSGNNTVSQFTIDQTTGELTSLGTPVDTGTNPYFGTTDVNGHVFVANEGTDTGGQSVSAYTITASGATAGQLVQIGSGPTAITGTTDTFNVLTSPNDNYLYVLDYGDCVGAGQVIAYGLTPATGVIGSVIGTPQPTDVEPTGMAIDPTGALLAIDNLGADDISLYTIGSNGAPTPTSPATVSTGTNPQFVVFYTAASDQ